MTAAPHTSGPNDSRSREWRSVTRGIVGGCSDSFEEYYDAMFGTMFQEARRLSNADESVCLDLVQEGMLKAMKSMKQLDSASDVEAWTRVVIRSVVYDYFRSASREAKLRQAYAEHSHDDDAREAVEKQERLFWIEEQLRSTPSELRSLLSYRYRLGWTLQQIAEYVGLKTGAVDGRIRRALEQFGQSAKDTFHDE